MKHARVTDVVHVKRISRTMQERGSGESSELWAFPLSSSAPKQKDTQNEQTLSVDLISLVVLKVVRHVPPSFGPTSNSQTPSSVFLCKQQEEIEFSQNFISLPNPQPVPVRTWKRYVTKFCCWTCHKREPESDAHAARNELVARASLLTVIPPTPKTMVVSRNLDKSSLLQAETLYCLLFLSSSLPSCCSYSWWTD